MNSLKERILKEGKVVNGDVIQVSGFLNHLVDVKLLSLIGKEFARIFSNCCPTKIITIEASGIPIATACAMEMGVPFIIAKKYAPKNLTGDLYTAEVFSFTKQVSFSAAVSKEYIDETDRFLILDDFLSYGSAVDGLIEIINKAHAALIGVGVCIEKSYLGGAASLRSRNINLHSLVKVSSLEGGVITVV